MAARKNPFDLKDRRGGPKVAHLPRTWTQEDQTARLEGYMEIPAHIWDHIRYGTHVRYYTKAGDYRPGGFVVKNPIDLPEKKKGMRLQNGFDAKAPNYLQWTVAAGDTSRIYAKPDATVLTVMETVERAVAELNENAQRIAERLRQVEGRLARLDGLSPRPDPPRGLREGAGRPSSRSGSRHGSRHGSRDGSRDGSRHGSREPSREPRRSRSRG